VGVVATVCEETNPMPPASIKQMSDRERKNIWLQFISFAGVGAIGTLAQYVVLILLAGLLGVSPVTASGAGFVAGGLINYFLNYWWTFRSKEPHLTSSVKFAAVASIGFGINWATMSYAVVHLQMQFLIAQVFTTTLVLVWTFIANRLWTFRSSRCD
jgi:putative flippase GtrA